MDFVEFFQVFFLTSSALLLASLSGLLSERSGVVNISIEGTMIMGATTYLFVMDPAGLAMYQMLGAGAVPIAAMIAGLVGMLFGLLLGTISVKFMGDQVIAGTALNLLAPILFLIVSLNVTGSAGDWIFSTNIDQMINWYSAYIFGAVIIIAVIIWIVINKSSIGLRLKAAGENPYALETAGVSVSKTRIMALAVAGILAGMAGSTFVMASGRTIFTGTVFGYGFIAIAILLFGQWKTHGVFIGSILIAGLMTFISVGFNYFEIIQKYTEIFQMIPFIMPLVVLVIFKSKGAPKAIGKPFNKTLR